ncbi:MAG: hypothetical protein ACI3XR_10090 [Eubacteriales bacterium]
MIKATDGKIIVKGNRFFLGIGIAATLMVMIGVCDLISSLVSFKADHTAADVFGLIFVSVFIGAVVWMAWKGYFEYSKKIVLSDEGVFYRNLLGKKSRLWSDIRDFGISYSGSVKGGGRAYDLFFFG